MKNPMTFYGAIALGIIALIAGIVMYAALHYHGKAYAVIAVGVVVLIAGIAGMVMAKPGAAAAK